jgi:hypothetical protein
VQDISNSKVFPWKKLVGAKWAKAKFRGGVSGIGNSRSYGAKGSMQASGNLSFNGDPGTDHGHECGNAVRK